MRSLLSAFIFIVALATAACSPWQMTGVSPGGQQKATVGNNQVESLSTPGGNWYDATDHAEVIVFYTEEEPYQGHPSSNETIETYGDAMSTVIGFWWQIDRHDPGQVLPSGSMDEQRVKHVIDLAHAQGLRVEGLLHNLIYGRTQWSIDVVSHLMNDKNAQTRLIRDVTTKAKHMGLSGVNIDIENVPPQYRQQWNEFVVAFADTLKKEGLEVSISVPSKTWDDPKNGWSGAFDYEIIGEAVDRVILMTYDEHGFVSGPGPIASQGWVERVVSYAVTAIPAHKVFVGIPGYGFNWGGSGAPQYISYRQAMAIAAQAGITPSWHTDAASPHYKYVTTGGEKREVWFENASSHSWKLDLVPKYGLGGIALWRGGLEDPALWSIIPQKFNVRKF